MKSFSARVYDVVENIPEGKVMSYGEVARRAGSPRAHRAVGSLMNKNRDFQNVPCHRVVCSDGRVGQYNGGEDRKLKKLKSEGVAVVDGKVHELQML